MRIPYHHMTDHDLLNHLEAIDPELARDIDDRLLAAADTAELESDHARYVESVREDAFIDGEHSGRIEGYADGKHAGRIDLANELLGAWRTSLTVKLIEHLTAVTADR